MPFFQPLQDAVNDLNAHIGECPICAGFLLDPCPELDRRLERIVMAYAEQDEARRQREARR